MDFLAVAKTGVASGTTMEALVYIANSLYLASYLVRDMLRLRVLTLVAASCLVTYFWLRPEPLVTVVCWNLFFVLLNAIQIARLVFMRRAAPPRTDLKVRRRNRASPIVQATNAAMHGRHDTWHRGERVSPDRLRLVRPQLRQRKVVIPGPARAPRHGAPATGKTSNAGVA